MWESWIPRLSKPPIWAATELEFKSKYFAPKRLLFHDIIELGRHFSKPVGGWTNSNAMFSIFLSIPTRPKHAFAEASPSYSILWIPLSKLNQHC